MFFRRYFAMPAKRHREHDLLGEAYVCCWVERKTLAAADRVARRNMKAELWDVLERDAAHAVSAPDYPEGDEWRAYYDQARIDKEVYVFHTSPRFPVYWIIAAARRGPRETAEAHYLISGESLLGKDHEVAVPNFWNLIRRHRALKAARDAIAAAGWAVKRVVSEKPCGQGDLPGDFHRYYDEAEEVGACLVFVRDTQPERKGAAKTRRGTPKPSPRRSTRRKPE
jgi:hypothetical protein